MDVARSGLRLLVVQMGCDDASHLFDCLLRGASDRERDLASAIQTNREKAMKTPEEKAMLVDELRQNLDADAILCVVMKVDEDTFIRPKAIRFAAADDIGMELNEETIDAIIRATLAMVINAGVTKTEELPVWEM